MNPGHEGRYAVSAQTDVGIVRDHNEDFVQTARKAGEYLVWVVADGMGGGARGEIASELAARAVVDTIAEGGWTHPQEALTAAFKVANRRVFDEGTGGGAASRSAMGTTLVAALVDETTGDAWIANVGDSRAYVVDATGIRQVTNDHSLVAERVRAGLITADEARSEENRNVITRAIGIESDVEVDLFPPEPIRPGMRMILCTDGLHGLIPDPDIARIVASEPLGESPAILVEAARAAGGTDNITVLIGGLNGQAAVSPLIVSRGPRSAAPAKRAGLAGMLAALPPLVVAAVGGIAVVGAAFGMFALTSGGEGPDPRGLTADPTSPTAVGTDDATQSPATTAQPTPIAYRYTVPIGPACADLLALLPIAEGRSELFQTRLFAVNPDIKSKDPARLEATCTDIEAEEVVCLPVDPWLYTDPALTEARAAKTPLVAEAPAGECSREVVPLTPTPIPTPTPAPPTASPTRRSTTNTGSSASSPTTGASPVTPPVNETPTQLSPTLTSQSLTPTSLTSTPPTSTATTPSPSVVSPPDDPSPESESIQ